MKLLDVLTAPWAIIPEKLLEIQNIYFTHLRGEKIDIKAIEAQIGKPLDNKKKTYEVQEGIAVIPIEGVLAKRANLFMRISGGTSMQLLEKDIDEAMADPDVKSLLFLIDSPGGTVDGTQELANHIYGLRGKKPMTSYAESLMGSAAYWIGSSADEIVMSGDTTQVGSIGVVATHVDVSKAEESAGIKTTEIIAGKYKRIASSYAPLSDEGRAVIQDIVDHLYSVFVTGVVQNRGASEDKVLTDMADGRIFLGQKAIKAGLVDRIETLDQTIGRMSKRGTPEHIRMVMNNRIRMLQEEKEKTNAL
jgi:signal peptide peptidase SppA